MKYFATFVLAILAACICSTFAQSHNVTWGHQGPYDSQLIRNIVTKKSKWLQIVSDDYVFPPQGQFNYRNITAIRVTDQYKNGTGGYATLLKGGPGNRNVTIHLKSQRSHGFNFIIDIYGR